MDETRKHYAKWNKPDTKEQTLHDATNLKWYRIGRFREKEGVVEITRSWEEAGVIYISTGFLFAMIKELQKLSVVMAV